MKPILIGLMILMCICGVGAIYLAVFLSDNKNVTNEILRNTRVQSQRAQQSISVLQNVDYAEAVNNLSSGLNALKLNVAESMSITSSSTGVSEISYEIKEREEKLLAQNVHPIRILRLSVKFKADNAMVISAFLQDTKESLSPWPIEVKACEIHRMAIVKLSVSCILDSYYWGLHD